MKKYISESIEFIKFIFESIFPKSDPDFLSDKNYLERPHCIYFLEGAGMIKIGRARNLTQRIRAIQTMSPVRLRLIGSMPGDGNDEREIHRKFSHLRGHGEWFRASQEIYDFVMKYSFERWVTYDLETNHMIFLSENRRVTQ